MDTGNRVIFVSYIRDPYEKKNDSSTQIMTKNLLCGIKKNAKKLIFVGIIDDNCNSKNVCKYYSNIADEVITVRSRLNLYNKNKYLQLLYNFYGIANSKSYRNELKRLDIDGDILIAAVPSFEPVSVCHEIMKMNPGLRYIQYWSDPYALSGIIPEQMTVKRLPFRILEDYIISKSKEIVYGTKTLMDFQKKLYRRHSKKMRYIDVCHGEEDISSSNKNDVKVFGYSGNYYSSVRNIIPLYEAFKDIKDAKLVVCGAGDVRIENADNIKALGRIPQSEISEVEREMDVLVCLLNSSCIQIPGKIFYNTNSDKVILIILDGPYRMEIKKYLETFERFEFCENNPEDIKKKVNEIIYNGAVFGGEINEKLLPKMVGCMLLKEIFGGGRNNEK